MPPLFFPRIAQACGQVGGKPRAAAPLSARKGPPDAPADSAPLRVEPGEADHGYVADPACERGTAQLQYLFVNGRWVRDRGLSQALQEAYRGLLMVGRYAVAFVLVELPPDRVDVNVHPAKAEVRFREPAALQQLLIEAVQRRLRAEKWATRLRAPQPPAPPSRENGDGSPGSGRAPVPEPALFPGGEARPPTARPGPRVLPGAEHVTPALRGAGKEEAIPAPAQPLRAVQLHDLYLVAEVPEGMLVIDQHALHERILFEQARQRLREGTLAVQRLLVPEPVSLPARQAALVLEQRDALAALGLAVEEFGGSTVLLTGYPVLLGRRPARNLLCAVAEDLAERDRVPSRDRLLHELLSLLACHAAVRAGDRLAPEEVAALLAQRHLAEDAHHCPHGRPTSLLFTRQDLDRQFRRT
jgi:DNA mismatch repair protein MutL